MKKEMIPIIFDLISGILVIAIIGAAIMIIPYQKAAQRDSKEAVIIDDYLKKQTVTSPSDLQPDWSEKQQEVPSILSQYKESQTPTLTSIPKADEIRIYKGEIDSILVIEKINLQKAIIRGPDNDYNLNRYLFVTRDQISTLGTDNYVIYGHCSQTYGHSFNRLDELTIGDTFQLIQGDTTFVYVVTNIQLEKRDLAAPLLNTGTNTVQLVSCEKKIADGFEEKRLIIVTAKKSNT